MALGESAAMTTAGEAHTNYVTAHPSLDIGASRFI
jgi:hypothetical protein